MQKTRLITFCSLIICLFTFSCEKVSVKTEEKNISETEIWLKLLNDLRTSGCDCGIRKMAATHSLTYNNLLENAAFGHSLDMFTNNFFDHKSSNGNDLGKRVTNAGYKWLIVGENILYIDAPQVSQTEVIEAWKNSPPHCINMMSPNFTEMGIGSKGGYWTLNLADN